MAEILASSDDINANLPSDDNSPVVVADDDNTGLIQISVSRVIRGYLSRVISNSILLSWASPESTPEIIREIAGKLIAAQLYFNEIAKSNTDVDDKHFSQRKYNEAITLLQQIIAGDIVMDGVTTNSTELSVDDFWPNSSTDRAFSMGQQF